MRTLFCIFLVLFAPLVLLNCTSNLEGEYEDPDRPVLIDDRFNDTDLKVFASLSDSLVKSDVISNSPKKPVILFARLSNRTHEHLSMKSLTNKILTALFKRGKVVLVDKERRKVTKAEYDYHASGMVDPSTRKGPGKQVGADYLLSGDLTSIVNISDDKDTKSVWYKITLRLTDLSKNVVVWQDDKEVKKIFRR